MINTDVYLKYQAYGHVIGTLRDKLTELNDVQRPAVNTVTRLLGDAAAQCRKEVKPSDFNPNVELADLIAWKLDTDEREKYLGYIADCTIDCLSVLKKLNRPTRGKIDTALGQVLHSAKAAMFPIQLAASSDKQNV